MARIIVGSWMVRYPLGGNLSWTLQWLVGIQQLGHEIYLVEKSGYPNSCYDPVKRTASDNCSYGLAAVNGLLTRFGLEHSWCYVDASEEYQGLSRERIEEVFRSADLFIDIGTHGAWLGEAANTRLRVLVDGEPGYRQMKMSLSAGEALQNYDFYYSNGANVGTAKCTAPPAGKHWRPLFNPVVVELFPTQPPASKAAFTTVMHWQAHEPLEFNGKTYGQKDVEFRKFMSLPGLTSTPVEIAVSGKNVPASQLRDAGWSVQDGASVTVSFDSFREYIRASKGEFSVCKNVFVMTNSGWFSDRSAAYLASGRPVVLQDSGFSDHLPCGRGLFAVRTVDQAAAAIDEIGRDYQRHSQWARDIAMEYLDAPRLLGKFLRELGI